MKQILIFVQFVISIILIVLILIQARGTGFGRGSVSSGSSFTRRGLEKLVFKATFIITGLFLIISLLALLV